MKNINMKNDELVILVAAMGNTSRQELRANIEEDFGEEEAARLVPHQSSFLEILTGRNIVHELFGKLSKAVVGGTDSPIVVSDDEIIVMIATLGNTSLEELRGNIEEDFGTDKAEEITEGTQGFVLNLLTGNDATQNLYEKLEEALA